MLDNPLLAKSSLRGVSLKYLDFYPYYLFKDFFLVDFVLLKEQLKYKKI